MPEPLLSQSVLAQALSGGPSPAFSISQVPAGAPQSIDMADGALELVYGITPGAGQVAITSSRLNVDPNSGGASEDLTIDSTAAALELAINNTGGESIVLKSNGGSTLATIPTAKAALYIGGIVIVSA